MTQTQVPILLIVFNRPDHTLKVINRLREVQPSQLFVAADGPRKGKNEEDKVQQVRSLIEKKIDWDCDLKTRFLEDNLGCGLGPATAISWFFESVESGIILEDDCLPNVSFFPFCEELLEKYKNDTRVMEIRSTYHLGMEPNNDLSYSFTRVSGTWGWGTWKRAWDLFDYEMTDFPAFKKSNLINSVFNNPEYIQHMMDKLESGYTKSIDGVWDCQWQFSLIRNMGLTIIPHQNLVKNIGFDEEATHCFDEHPLYSKMNFDEMSFPLKHPKFIVADLESDITFFNLLKITPTFNDHVNRVKGILFRTYQKFIKKNS